MENTLFDKYAYLMRNLSVKVTRGVMAPHKAIMLLSIMDMIEDNKLTTNIILADEMLSEYFKRNWNSYVSNRSDFSLFRCSIWTPYWHMKNECFWHFQPIISNFDVETLVPPGQTASIGIIRNHIQYAYLDGDLFGLLQITSQRNKLREILIHTYKLQIIEDKNPKIKDDSSFRTNNKETEELSFMIDKSYRIQLIEQIMKLDGIISLV